MNVLLFLLLDSGSGFFRLLRSTHRAVFPPFFMDDRLLKINKINFFPRMLLSTSQVQVDIYGKSQIPIQNDFINTRGRATGQGDVFNLEQDIYFMPALRIAIGVCSDCNWFYCEWNTRRIFMHFFSSG